jgi:hypothetical protein
MSQYDNQSLNLFFNMDNFLAWSITFIPSLSSSLPLFSSFFPSLPSLSSDSSSALENDCVDSESTSLDSPFIVISFSGSNLSHLTQWFGSVKSNLANTSSLDYVLHR